MTDTLFDLDAYTVNPQDKPATNERWYLWVEYGGKRYALVASHDNGGGEWGTMHPNMNLPKRYKTFQGAQQGKRYHQSEWKAPIHIDVWTGKPKAGEA